MRASKKVLNWSNLSKAEQDGYMEACANSNNKDLMSSASKAMEGDWREIEALYQEDEQASQIILDEREKRMDELKLGESIEHAGESWKKIYCQAGFGHICDYEHSLTDYDPDERDNCNIIDGYAYEYVYPDESGSLVICAECLPQVTKVDVKKMLDT